jgi:hypothetical protein
MLARGRGSLVGIAALLVALSVERSAAAQQAGAAPAPAEPSTVAAAAPAPTPEPHWEIDGPHKELLDVVRGPALEHHFTVKNTGSAPLILSAPFVPCRCAEVTFDREIAPGGEGRVNVVAQTTEFAGPVQIEILLKTNESARPVAKFELSAVVKPAVLIKPGYARLAYVLTEPVGGVKQRVWAPDFPGLEVLSVKSPYPFVVVTAREMSAAEKAEGAGRQWELTVELTAAAEVGPLVGAIQVFTNHPLDKVAKFPLSGFVRPAIALTPPIAKPVEPLSRSSEHTLPIDVRVFTTQPIVLTGVASKSPASLGVEIKPGQPGRRYVVDVKLPKGLPVGPFTGTVRVATDHPQLKEVVIPIEATIRD